MENNNYYWIWLSSLVRLSPGKRYQLLEHFGDPAFLFNAGREEIEAVGLLSDSELEAVFDKALKDKVIEHYDSICRHDIEIITLKSPNYPRLLKCIYDPPTVLYAKGKLNNDSLNIAIVGSRNATLYGLDTSAKLAKRLAGYGLTVVSGMARGIDTYAHRGAISVAGNTVAVLGCGLDKVYPPENKKLMQQIIENGAVITEFLPGTAPLAYNFPARNRIISGISAGVIIVEAGEKSGSLITTDYALEQGREVFSVPGNIDSSVSVGTNRLIRDGAKIVTGIFDILDELGVNHEKPVKMKNPEYECLDNDEKRVVKCLRRGMLDIDAISRKCGMESNLVSSILLMLELKAVVEQHPGKKYRLIT